MSTTTRVEYDSNNSGGSWWLTDENWRDLEAAGWLVVWGCLWFCNDKYQRDPKPAYVADLCGAGKCKGHRRFRTYDEAVQADKRWLGCLARGAWRDGLTLRDAAEEWERVTGLSATDAGCACCGQPHSFTEYNTEGKYVASGPSASYEARW